MYKKTPINQLKPNYKIHVTDKKRKDYQETKAIVHRLYTQTLRKPITILISIIQPLLWLIMFGALFQNAPIYLFDKYKLQYTTFLNPGIIVFTAFNSSINTGLNIIFDREFGFLNKILISPIKNKKSIIYSCIIHAWTITMIQVSIITSITYFKNFTNKPINFINLSIGLIVISTIIIIISNLSIYSAFTLPGHIEFIGITSLLLNLPTLFTSTALAPLSFMPQWLQILCCMNPLTYAIETIRNLSFNNSISLHETIIKTPFIHIRGYHGLTILIILNMISFISINHFIKYKYDKN